MLEGREMSIGSLIGSVMSVRRKLRAVSAVIADPAATAHEKANASALKERLERRLREAGVPAGDWTDTAFRLGKWAGQLTKSSSPPSPKGDWTDNAHRLGKALRRGYKRWSSE
jgi:hypothetical protein